ncbi:hypothetical protein MesoLjLb_55350 [Mesorhizobium sp. L-8-3]|nr:hypothetical protein MesoLjLb_55350 [Mesorhizobium sp. L-8-3]
MQSIHPLGALTSSPHGWVSLQACRYDTAPRDKHSGVLFATERRKDIWRKRGEIDAVAVIQPISVPSIATSQATQVRVARRFAPG